MRSARRGAKQTEPRTDGRTGLAYRVRRHGAEGDIMKRGWLLEAEIQVEAPGVPGERQGLPDKQSQSRGGVNGRTDCWSD